MGCSSCENKIITSIYCTNCGRELSLRHHKDKDPIAVATAQGKICSKCGEKQFILGAEGGLQDTSD